MVAALDTYNVVIVEQSGKILQSSKKIWVCPFSVLSYGHHNIGIMETAHMTGDNTMKAITVSW